MSVVLTLLVGTITVGIDQLTTDHWLYCGQGLGQAVDLFWSVTASEINHAHQVYEVFTPTI